MSSATLGFQRWAGAAAGVGLALTAALLAFRGYFPGGGAGLAAWLAAALATAAALGCAGLARSRGREAAELAKRLAAADRSGMRRAFRYGEELYRELFDHNPAAVYRSTIDGLLLDCNEAMVRLFGYPDRESFLAQPVTALFWDPEDRPKLVERLCREEVIRNVEVRFRKRNGELFWGLKNEGLLRSPAGLPTVIEGTLFDVTERKRAEEALRESESVLRSFYETSPVMMGVVEIAGEEIRHLSSNTAAARFFGRSPEDMRGRRADQVGALSADEFRVWLERFRASERLGEPVRFEHRERHRDGTRWADVRISFLGATGDGRSRFAYVVNDVTERKLSEEALRQSEASIRSLQEIAGARDLTFREKVRSLLALGCDAFEMELSALHQVEAETCVVFEARTPGNVVPRGSRTDVHQTFYPAALAAGRPLSFTRLEEAPAVEGCPRILPVESYIGGVVLVEGRPWGLLSFAGQSPRPAPFRNSDYDLLELMILWLGRELERDRSDREMALVRDMGDLLQSCKTMKEACQVISRQAIQLFPGVSGVVYRADPAHQELQTLVAWGQAGIPEDPLPMGRCWACRRDEEHFVPDPATGLPCGHLSALPPSSSLCVPMRAHGEAGVLHLRLDPGADGAAFTERRRRLAAILAKQLALALSNLELLERLHEQSIRDPLTGLYNRRHFETTLRDEVRRADRSGSPLALLMIDVDHFKRINDTFEHEGGDAVLQALGQTLIRNCRAEDVPCRLGGEELALLLPGASLEAACQRAEELREQVRALRVAHLGRTIHSLTISAGVAVYPDHGDDKEVVRLADRAMYRSKETGRDRVSVAPLPLRRRRADELSGRREAALC
jgi:diguanylate cyclase (GGDEF)-like protein/PAS domain S-box-containing protein